MKIVQKIFVLATVAALCFVVGGNVVRIEASGKMPTKLYNLVKGKWYHQASSGGWDIKFTRNYVKYYDRKPRKLSANYKIVRVKKITIGHDKGHYRIVYKMGKNHYCSFINADKKATGFWFYGSASGKDGYSGSSSIELGKWKW